MGECATSGGTCVGGALAEQGGADADAGCTFFDSQGEIAAHAHGEDLERDARVRGGPTAAPCAQGAEAGSRLGLGHAPGSDGHEAAGFEAGEIGEALEELGGFSGCGVEAGLGFLGAELDFDEDRKAFAEAGGGLIEALGEAEGVEGVNGVKEFDGALGLVGLEVADEVDAEVALAKRGEVGGFGGELLDAVFAEEGKAERRGLGDGGGGVGLGDGHQFDFGAGAVGGAAGGCDFCFEAFEIVCESRHRVPVGNLHSTHASKITMWTIVLLIFSNVFMTFAWYGHLKFRQEALWKVILVSWGIAFFEYLLQVPANRLGAERFSPVQLKVMQEIITLVVFAVFTLFYFGEHLRWNHAAAGACLVAAAFFVFHSW